MRWLKHFEEVLIIFLMAAMTLVTFMQVVARYAFGKGSIMMEELQWHLYAIGFMLGLSFTEMRERNVRIDVLNSAGVVVDTINQSGKGAGRQSFEWTAPEGVKRN